MKKIMIAYFVKLLVKTLPAEILFENENLIVIQDIKPSAPIHHLIIPKEHIQSIAHLEEKDALIIGKMFLTLRDDAKKAGLTGYKTVFNVGRDGGQIIDHLHLHLLGGWNNKKDIERMPHPNLDK